MMTTGALQNTPNVIHHADLGLFFRGVQAGDAAAKNVATYV